MSKIEELIEKLCPNGVEYKKLEEICISIKTGKLNANAMVENGKYPFFTCDATPFKINEYAFDTEAIIISGNGSQVGHINYYFGKFNVYQRTYVLFDFVKTINIRFLLHFLNGYLKPYILNNCKKGSVPYITLPMLQDFKIPVPPLEVQKEIVKILDNFTELTAELTAELQARRKQYEFYRDKLLTFEAPKIEWKTLEEIFDIKGGYTPSKANTEYWENGTIPWFRLEDINENGRILFDAKQHVNELALKKSGLFPENSIIITTSATIGEYALIKVPFLCNQRFTCLGLKKDYQDKLISKFNLYYCSVISKFCKSHLNVGNFASVDMELLKKFKFPIPPLEIQERIVNVLDNFDKICSDLGIGLPAEIEARQKQFEYYREKLLTFKNGSATVFTDRQTDRAN